MNRLKALADLGQSVWLDFLSRDFLQDGGLDTLIRDDGLKGVTSNPSIFEKAIAASSQYDTQIAEAVHGGAAPVMAIYEDVAIADIRQAADILRPVYEETGGRDGFVSLEVSPYLAMDTDGTIAEARRLWQMVDRPNLMVKVPGTGPGIPAIRRLISEGLNINITLLFAQAAYEQVVEAYLAGLEARAAAGAPIDRIASVASFFVSRIDTAVDKRLDQVTGKDRAALEGLRGKVAVANAKLAYQRYLKRFDGPRWQKLAANGARTQRLLWASTSAKNPAYRDVLYVEELIGRDTINTLPMETLRAFRDHGEVAETLTLDAEEAGATLAELEQVGVSLDQVTAELVVDGVRLFADSFDKLLGAVAGKRRRLLGDGLAGQSLALGGEQAHVDREREAWRAGGKVRRLWARDASLWTGRDEAKWLAWLDIVDRELPEVAALASFADEIRHEGFRDVLLLGMGGSSLGPEVLGESLGSAAGYPRLHVLDSTDPQEVQAHERRIDLAHTLFIVSSKSGSTLEPTLFTEYFLQRAAEAVGPNLAPSRFVAITDPGSALQRFAEAKGFRRVFHGVPAIGGRYSVLSKFGLVPLGLMGREPKAFLESARIMVRSCGPDVPPSENPGVELGVVMSALARRGRDKITVVASPPIAAFGAWAEQLIAESTGKNGKGLIPVDREPLGTPEQHGDDRLFIYLRLTDAADGAQDAAMAALEQAGHPIVRISLKRPDQLPQEFFRWEIATAVAGAGLEINPFDQPDVEASKVATRELTDAFEKQGSLPAETPVFRQNGIALYTDEGNARALRQAGANSTFDSWIGAHLSRINAGDYFAALAYVARNEAHTRVLSELRLAVRDRKRVATCVGFGPRFLHSTGQAYKGGPNTGVFLQITADDAQDAAIAGRKATFGIVKAAQARGDFRVLAQRGRRVLRAHIGPDVEAGLAALRDSARRVLG